MYEFRYDYVKMKYREKATLHGQMDTCYMNTDNLIVYTKKKTFT